MNGTQLPTVGRIVHVYSDVWSGPRPGLVVMSFGNELANVRVFFDDVNDTAAITLLGRNRMAMSVPVTNEPDSTRIGNLRELRVWACWPPRVQ